MQKLIHITDPHITAPGVPFHGLDPTKRLQDTLSKISHAHPDAKAIVITGDLTDTGDPVAYEILQDVLAETPLPIHITLGNHDNRANFRAVFGGTGYAQTAFDLGSWKVLLLDTLDEESDYGVLDGERLEWLESELVAAGDRPVVLALHHTPDDLHIMPFAQNDMKQSHRFLDVVVKSGVVRHMLFGHRHIAAAGSYAGIPFTVNRGTAHHIAIDFDQYGKFDLVAAAPSYDIVCLTEKSVIVHCCHGLETIHPIIRAGDTK